jgi:hypothetical protein
MSACHCNSESFKAALAAIVDEELPRCDHCDGPAVREMHCDNGPAFESRRICVRLRCLRIAVKASHREMGRGASRWLDESETIRAALVLLERAE